MHRVSPYITALIIFALVCAGIYEVVTSNWSNLFVVAQATLLISVPYVLDRKFGIYTPPLLRTGIVIFIFATLFLGEVQQFYVRYEWWDTLLHGVAGVGLTLIGYMLLVYFYKGKELHSTPFATSFLAFSITMAFAVGWEVYEFMVDTFFNPDTRMQPSNKDTMIDLIVSIAGSLVVCVSGYRYLRYRKSGIASEVMRTGTVGK